MNLFGGAEMADVANDKWINIDEAVGYLGVKSETIRDWLRKNKGICLQDRKIVKIELLRILVSPFSD